MKRIANITKVTLKHFYIFQKKIYQYIFQNFFEMQRLNDNFNKAIAENNFKKI